MLNVAESETFKSFTVEKRLYFVTNLNKTALQEVTKRQHIKVLEKGLDWCTVKNVFSSLELLYVKYNGN